MKKPSEFVFNGETIPESMCGGLERYLESHVRPGQFLSAVLQNDLREAVGRADDKNVRLLHVYVAYLYNEAPAKSWGSKEAFDAWLTGES